MQFGLGKELLVNVEACLWTWFRALGMSLKRWFKGIVLICGGA